MKTHLFIILALITFQAFAKSSKEEAMDAIENYYWQEENFKTCIEKLEFEKENLNVSAVGIGTTGGLVAPSFMVFAFGPAGLLVVPATLAIVSPLVAMSISKGRAIRLIQQSDKYLSDLNQSERPLPGKILAKLYKHVRKHSSVTLPDLAKIISTGNKDMSLCHDGLTIHKLKKRLKLGLPYYDSI